MLERGRNIFLGLAAMILLLHNFTPHLHHGEMSEEIHQQSHASTCIWNILQTVFHNNLGDKDHFEHIVVPQLEQPVPDAINAMTSAQGDDEISSGDSDSVLSLGILPAAFSLQLPLVSPYFEYKRQEESLISVKKPRTLHALRAPPFLA